MHNIKPKKKKKNPLSVLKAQANLKFSQPPQGHWSEDQKDTTTNMEVVSITAAV